MSVSITAKPVPTDAFVAGQTWHADFETREVETITRGAGGEPLVGYLSDTGTALATATEFAEWVEEESATVG